MPDTLFPAAQPEDTAIWDTASHRALSFADLATDVDRYSWQLQRNFMVAAGDRVCWLGYNSPQLIIAYLACVRIGAIFAPLNWKLAHPELVRIVEDCAPRCMFLDDPASESKFPVETFPAEALSDAEQRSLVEEKRDENAPSVLLYTSGSTGKPKGVMLSERNISAAVGTFAAAIELTPKSTVLVDTPMYHAAGLILSTRAPLAVGAAAAISPYFYPTRSLRHFNNSSLAITHGLYAPQMLEALSAHPQFSDDHLSRLTCVVVAGSPYPPQHILRWQEKGVTVVQHYGMTEAPGALTMPLDRSFIARKPESVGLAPPHLQWRVVGTDQDHLPPGKIGELRLKGPITTLGYWKNPAGSASLYDSEGWLRTGDLAMYDEGGFIFIKGRLKDMYICSGENVYCAEIEAVIADLPEVQEVAVLGVPDPLCGEVGAAFVSLKEGQNLDPGFVRRHCGSFLASFKIPKHVFMVEELPKTSTGKLRKLALRDRADYVRLFSDGNER